MMNEVGVIIAKKNKKKPSNRPRLVLVFWEIRYNYLVCFKSCLSNKQPFFDHGNHFPHSKAQY